MLLCILSFFVSGCASVPVLAPTSDIYWPTEGWRTSTPEEQGMDAQKLTEMLDVIRERDINIHSFLVIRNGYLVSETYFKGYQPDQKHDLQSVGRSFTATLIGIAIDKGYIKGTDQRIVDFFPERTVANLNTQKQAMTLEDLLTMRTGFQWQEMEGAFESMQKSPDWTQYVLDMPMAEQPGSRWNYCSICSHILSAILHETTGMNPRDFAEQYLFEPLGIANVIWMKDPAGIPLGAGGFQLTPRDMAKLGYLYLRHGEWDGHQIVSPEWVETSTQSHVDVTMNEHFGYGYHWITVTSMDGYAASGGGGQIILTVPKYDLVIVTTGWTEESIFELIEQYVLPAVENSE
ncbi:MAG TPA: serine hydrolase [Anaerolineales bacterium]|nr:serine hydrolase [Anaerolineales bacterium]